MWKTSKEGGCAKLYLSLSSGGSNGAIAEAIIPSLPVGSPNIHVDEDNEVVVICCKIDVDDVATFRWRRVEEEEGMSLTSREAEWDFSTHIMVILTSIYDKITAHTNHR